MIPTLTRLPSKIASAFMPDADHTKIVVSDSDDSGVDHEGALKKLEEFREKIKRGLPIPLESSLSFASSIVDAIQHNDGIDDRKMLLEHMLTFVSRLPASTAQEKIANKLVELLYNDLPHPPATYIGNYYAYRQADGSCNNLSDPNMGKAGMPYARSVQQAHPLPRNQLPDAGLIFDTLLKRDKFVKHPAGLSSLMFSFAALVIHTVFRTSHEDVNVNETSSYIDLAPLYGHNQEAQDKVRRRDGRGLLKNDAFAEDRLLLLPPATCVILVLFNRNHNYIARKLLEINERGTFQDPDAIPEGPQRMTLLLQQEEEIFQTARLINCTWFASAVFSDYFSAILGLVRQGSSWSLNPFGEIRNADRSLFERGRGNVCSVEFNCLYRWHATTSQEDEEWIHQVFGNLFPGADPDKLTINDMKAKAKDLQAQEPDVSHWTFGNLKRNEDGFFNDAELAAVLNNSTDHAAGAFRARGTPQIMRLHEIMGIEQNRRWGVCSLNDFRKFLGLKPYSTFLEWNSDPEVASAAEKLYGDIDMLELYVGLQAEEAKPVVDGAGLCPAYTISRAILSDAIALCRGDRFYTADYTPFNMTAWGFQDCQRDPTAPGYGSTLGRLFLRTLPNHFSHNSTYTWFPLMTPQAMKPILKNLGDFHLYDFQRPKENMGVATVSEYKEVMEVLKAAERFGMPSHTKAATVITGHGFFIAPQDMFRGEREQRAILKALTGSPDATQKIKEYFHNKTRELMLHECWTGVGTNVRNVNIIRDVLKVVPIYWACEVAGIPLTDKEDPEDGVYSAKEMYEVLTDIYSYLFLDVAQTNMLNLQEKVKGQIEELLGYIKAAHGTGIRLSVSGFLNALSQIFRGKSDHEELAARFATLGYDSDTLANSILAILVGATVEMSQALVHIVNLYLDDNKPADLQALCQNPRLGAKDEALLQGLILEALRLDPAFTGVFREALKDEVVGKQTIPAGTKIFVDIKSADLDKTIFPSPKDFDPSRGSIDKYPFGDGSQRCLGQDLSTKIMASVLRGVFSFRKVRRAPGDSGKLKRFKSDTMKTSAYEYLSKQQKQTPWATSMIIQFE